MRFLIAVVLVLNCGLCCGKDIPDGNIKGRVVSKKQALSAEQAAELVADFEGDLRLRALTSIEKDLARELVKYEGALLYLHGRTSIDESGLTYLK